MTEVRFRFVDAQPDGTNAGAGTAVWCAPIEVEIGEAHIRSTKSFPVDLVDGEGVATMNPGVWRVDVFGVAGYVEEWVRVVEGEPVAFSQLERVDPATVDPLTPLPPSAQEILEAARQIQASSVVSATVEDGELVLQTYGGDTVQAGAVSGPRGPAGGTVVEITDDPVFSGVAVIAVAESSLPRVTVHPASISPVAGTLFTLTSIAVGAPTPVVQWETSVDGGETWVAVAGATSTTLTRTAAAGEYRAVFINASGSVVSNIATVTVTPGIAPAVEVHPVDVAVDLGAEFTLYAYASGVPAPGVQWETSADGETWIPVAGATSTTLTRAASTSGFWRAVFTNVAGSATSNPAEVTTSALVGVAPAWLIEPGNFGTSTEGETGVLVNVAASGDPDPTFSFSYRMGDYATLDALPFIPTTAVRFTTPPTRYSVATPALVGGQLVQVRVVAANGVAPDLSAVAPQKSVDFYSEA